MFVQYQVSACLADAQESVLKKEYAKHELGRSFDEQNARQCGSANPVFSFELY